MRELLAVTALVGLWSAASTAEAGCLSPTSCVCDNLAAGTLLRGVVSSVDGSHVEIEVADVFRDGTLEGVVAGDVMR